MTYHNRSRSGVGGMVGQTANRQHNNKHKETQ